MSKFKEFFDNISWDGVFYSFAVLFCGVILGLLLGQVK